ncbi:MAG: YSC84-related protein [Nitrospinota bacterium]|nr:hypothetical protein [Nitrospinota bacterium]
MKSAKYRLLLSFLALTALFTVVWFSFPKTTSAAEAYEIDINVEATLKRFIHEVPAGSDLLTIARGVLVFPSVIKAGFWVGGEYGEGALQIGGETVEYYNIASASIGLQLGAQTRSMVIIFLDEDALNGFINSSGWKAGVDGNLTVVKWGGEKNVDSLNLRDPIIAFVFGNKGLMYNLTLEGSKISRIAR